MRRSLSVLLGLSRKAWSDFISWLPTSVAAANITVESAIIGVWFKEEIYAHPIASTVLQLFVFVSGNFCDNLLKEKDSWFTEPPRYFPAEALLEIFHVGLKLSIVLGTAQYVVFMTLLSQDVWNSGLVVSSSVVMLIMTAVYPPFYLALVYLAVKIFPRMRSQISRLALPMRNVIMTILASWMVYTFVAPYLR
jgi:hypothetical protein